MKDFFAGTELFVKSDRCNVAMVRLNINDLGPAGRETADLVSARSAIPRFGDQLDCPEFRVLAVRLKKPALGVETLGLAGETGSKIKAKPVDVSFDCQ